MGAAGDADKVTGGPAPADTSSCVCALLPSGMVPPFISDSIPVVMLEEKSNQREGAGFVEGSRIMVKL